MQFGPRYLHLIVYPHNHAMIIPQAFLNRPSNHSDILYYWNMVRSCHVQYHQFHRVMLLQNPDEIQLRFQAVNGKRKK